MKIAGIHIPSAAPHILSGLGLLASLAACSENFMSEKTIAKTTASTQLAATADAAGNYTAALDPNSTSTQVMRAATGAVAGSAIAMPPGALSIPVSITIGSGETLASSAMSQQMGISDNAASPAGPAVSFVPSSNVEASSPFTLSIPISTSARLALNDVEALSKSEKLVVIFKAITVTNGVTSYSVGMLTRSELTVGSQSVQFQTKRFGTFQLAVTEVKITQKIEKPTDEPPVLKADASNPLVGVWNFCQERETSGYYGGSSGTSTSVGATSTTPPGPPPPQNVANRCLVPGSGQIQVSFQGPAAKTMAGADGVPVYLTRGGQTATGTVLGVFGGSAASYISVPGWSPGLFLEPGDVFEVKVGTGCYFRDFNSGVEFKSSSIFYSKHTPPVVRNRIFSFTTPGDTLSFSSGFAPTANEEFFFRNTTNIAGASIDVQEKYRFVDQGSGIWKIQNVGTSTFLYFTSASDLTFETVSPTELACSPHYLGQVQLICDGTNLTTANSGSSGGTPPTGTSSGSGTSSNSGGGGGTDDLGFKPGTKYFQQESVKFSNNTFIYSSNNFEGAGCTGRMLSRREETGSYTLGKTTGGGVYPISIKMNTSKAMIFAPENVSFANSNPGSAGCGLNTWKPGEPKDLSNSACADKDEDHSPPSEVRIEAKRIYFKEDGGWDDSRSMLRQ